MAKRLSMRSGKRNNAQPGPADGRMKKRVCYAERAGCDQGDGAVCGYCPAALYDTFEKLP